MLKYVHCPLTVLLVTDERRSPLREHLTVSASSPTAFLPITFNPTKILVLFGGASPAIRGTFAVKTLATTPSAARKMLCHFFTSQISSDLFAWASSLNAASSCSCFKRLHPVCRSREAGLVSKKQFTPQAHAYPVLMKLVAPQLRLVIARNVLGCLESI